MIKWLIGLRARVATAAAASLLVFPAGCSKDSDAAAVADSTAPVMRDLATYDAFVLGSAANDPANADVYAIRFEPFVIDRITDGKRISFLGADRRHLVVAAADENIDQLAVVTGTGGLEPVPGLGRPFAYAPVIVDGVMYFDDAQGDEAKGENRYFAWDLDKQTKKLLLQTNEEFGGVQPISRGRTLLTKPSLEGDDEVLVRTRSGKTSRYLYGGDAGHRAVGGEVLASTLVGENDRFGDSPIATVLLDLDTGKKKRIDGLQFIAWNPEGTRILARRTDVLTDSRLVVLDPAKPDAPVDLQTVPGLAIYSGAWVRGDAPS